MNVGYKDINTSDAARMLNVTPNCVSGWCKNGYICAQDLSEKGSTRPRYRISDAEITRVKKLIKKYGIKTWRKHYMEGHDEPIIPIPNYRCEPFEEVENYTEEEEQTVEVASIETVEEVKAIEPTVEDVLQAEDDYDNLPTRTDFDAEKALDAILKIQDLKERLSNLNAERNQIINELKIMKEEYLPAIEELFAIN